MRNSHFPDPATFEPQNSEFIMRRFGRTSKGVSRFLYDPKVSSLFTQTLSLQDQRLQGGRVSYDFSPAALTGTNLAVSVMNDVRATGMLPSRDVHAVYLPPWVTVPVDVNAAGAAALDLPPFSEWIHSMGTVAFASHLNGNVWQASIPAGTLLQLAVPAHVTESRPSSLNLPVGRTTVNLSTAMSGTYVNFGGDYNVLFADLRPGHAGNLSELGYAVRLPTGTFIQTTVDVNIRGSERQLTVSGGVTVALRDFSYQLTPDPDTFFTYGVTRDLELDPGTPDVLSVPANTPVVSGSQGLLPTPTFPGQLPSSAAVFIEQRGIEGKRLAIGGPQPIVRDDDEVLIITDPQGAFGSFPAEVTMHPLADHRISSPSGLSANENVTREVSTSTVVRFGSVLTPTPIVNPYPISSGDSVIVPAPLYPEGIVTMPHDTKFFYPGGTKIPVGRSRFSHGGPGSVFGYYNSSNNIAPGSSLSGVNSVNQPGKNAVVHLPPGAVIGNVSIVVSTIQPDGSMSASTDLHERVTLVNGGIMTYTQLLHYNEGDFSMVPITKEQSGFRIESMGMGFVDPDSPPAANSLPELLSEYLRSAAPTVRQDISGDPLHDGFHLYPYHDVVVPMSRRMEPVASVVETVISSLPARVVTFPTGVTTYLENPISRAGLSYYNVGDQAVITTIELTPVANRALLQSGTTPGYSLVDELGVGVELDTDSTGVVLSYDSSVLDITATLNNIQTISLDLGRGVSLQANPGRMHISTTVLATMLNGVLLATTQVSAFVALNQFGAWENNTPLVAPFIPAESFGSFTTDPTADLFDVVRLSTALVTTFINPRASEIALRLSPNAMLGTFERENSDASDYLSLGSQFRESQRVVVELHNDALAYDSDDPSDRMLVPRGSRVEYGLLEQNNLEGTVFVNDFPPGGRVFSGVGFYPTGNETALRFERDQTSFAGPTLLTLGILNSPDPTLDFDFTVSHVGGDAIITMFNVGERITVRNPRLLLPAGLDIDAGTFMTLNVNLMPLPPPAPPVVVLGTVFLLDPDIALVGEEITQDSNTYSSGVIRLGNLSTRSLFIVLDESSTEEVAFNFVANSNGAVVNTVLAARTGIVNKGQIFRMRVAEEQFVTTSPPELHALIDLSWSGRDDQWKSIDFVPDDLVFAQNNPLFYAVAEECRKHMSGLADDCAAQRGEGLNAWALPGSEAPLPSSSAPLPGLVVHGFRGSRLIPSSMEIETASGATVTVAGIRFQADGMVDVLRNHPSVANAIEVDPAAPNIGRVGDTVVLLPNPRGLQFLQEDESLNAFLLPESPTTPKARGYNRPLTVVIGGYTQGNAALSAYRLTISSAGTLEIGTGSTLAISQDDSRAVSLFLGPGSRYSIGGDTIDVSGLKAANPFSSTEVVLGSDSVRTGAGLDLPERIAAGSTLTIAPTSAATVAELLNAVSFSSQDLAIQTPGYAWQGLIRGTNITAQLRGVTGQQFALGLRNNNFDATNLNVAQVSLRINTLTQVTTTVALAAYNRNDVKDIAMPQSSYLEPDWLSTDAYASAIQISVGATVTVQGVSVVVSGTPAVTNTISCLVCEEVIDLSPYANSTVVSGTPPTLTTYVYDPTISFTHTVFGKNVPAVFSLGTNLVTAVAQADYSLDYVVGLERGGTLFFDSDIVTLRIEVEDPAAQPSANPGAPAFPVSISFRSYIGLPMRSVVDPTLPGSTVTLALNTINPALSEPTFTSSLTLSLPQNLGEIPPVIGFTLDRLGDSGMTITLGQPYELPAPVAIYQGPAANVWPVTSTLTYAWDLPVPTTLANAFEASQLFIDRPLNPTVAASLFQDTRVQLTGDEANRQIGLQVPVPVLTVAGTALPAGSVLYPEVGLALRALTFNTSEPFTITLGATGAVGNIVAGGGSGRPAYSLRQRGRLYPFTISSPTWLSITISLGATTYYNGTDALSSVVAGREFSLERLRVKIPLDALEPTTTVPEIDTRAMDGVLRRPEILAQEAFFRSSPNLVNNPAYLFVPYRNRITFNPSAEIVIHPFTENPGQRSFSFPPNTTLDAHTPTYLNSAARHQPTIDGMEVDRVLEARYDDTYLVQDDDPDAVEYGQNQDVSFLGNDVYQNLWIRLEDDITLTINGDDLILLEDTVINPLLGTFLPPVDIPDDRTLLDRVRINALSSVTTPSEDIELTRPVVTLPQGLTLGIGTQPVQFSNIKAILGHSPRPLRSNSQCVSASALLTISQSQERVSEERLLDVAYKYTGIHDSAVTVGVSATARGGPIDPDSRQIGDAHKCMLLDIPENTDQDNWFVIGTFLEPHDSSNDVLRMIGGRLSP